MNAVVQHKPNTNDHQLAVRSALRNSLYPGASEASIDMVLSYCTAAGLDPMQKPVHIVPMWDSKMREMRDVVMPGIGLYRVQAARSGQFAGVSEPEFGPEVTQRLGGVDFTFPEWCKVTARRQLANGAIAEFTAVEYWIENYAIKGGKERDQSPNAMWTKRVRGQIAKCAQAQALRLAFPEIGAQPSAEEMEGKEIIEAEIVTEPQQLSDAQIAARRKGAHDEALARHAESVAFIKERIGEDDMESAHKEWSSLPNDDAQALWLATTKGGVFTTDERRALKEYKTPLPQGDQS